MDKIFFQRRSQSLYSLENHDSERRLNLARDLHQESSVIVGRRKSKQKSFRWVKIDIRLLDEGEQTQISFLQSKCLVPQTMDALNRSDSFKKTNPAEKKGIFVAKMLTHQEGQNKKPYHPKRVVIDPTYNQTKQGEKRDKDQSLINLESPQAKFRSNSPHEKKPFEINLHQKKEEIAVRQSLAEILRKPKLNCRPITVSKEESPDKVSKGVAGSKKQTFSIQKLKKKIQETTIDNLKDQNDKVQHKGPKPILNLAVSIKTFTPKAKETGPKPLFSHAQAPKAVGVSIRAKTPDKLGNYGHENPIANNKLPNQSSLLAHNRKDHRTGIKTPELSKIDLL